MWSSDIGNEHKHAVISIRFYVLTLYACVISKYTFIRSGSSKKTTVPFYFDHVKHSCGHQIVVMSPICGHAYPILRSSKRTLLFIFDHFKHSIWSSISGHKYPMVFWFGTMDSKHHRILVNTQKHSYLF